MTTAFEMAVCDVCGPLLTKLIFPFNEIKMISDKKDFQNTFCDENHIDSDIREHFKLLHFT